MIRLNGWQRIGTIISVLWVTFILSLASYQYFEVWQQERREADCKEFLSSKPNDAVDKSVPAHVDLGCLLPENKIARLEILDVLAMAILPIISLWLLAYGVIRTSKWVIDGFKSK